MKSAQNMVAMMMMPMWSRLVAEVLGGVDINWSPPITDWSHYYGNYDGDDDGHDGHDDDGNEWDDDHDKIKCCCTYYI